MFFFVRERWKRLHCSAGRILPSGHTDFQRFIVLGRSRTGSNLLIDLLQSHPHVDAQGELFCRLAGRDPGKMLKDIFHPRPRRIQAVGFKIFYPHPEDTDSDEVWQRLRAIASLKVIHLRRENVLRTVTSRHIASATDLWAKRRGGLRGRWTVPPKVTLDPDQVIAEIRHTKETEEASARFFADHALIEVRYEDLVADHERQMRQIQTFLGIEPRRLHATHMRQNPQPLSQLIENYDQLKQALAQTEWAHFLRDE